MVPPASPSSRSGSPTSAPSWLQTTVVTTPNGTTSNALVVADIAHVLWAVNLGCLGLHLWPYRADDPGHADELRIDLDPQPGTSFDEIRAAAACVAISAGRARACVGYPKTTGNRGLHIYVRLERALGQLRGPVRRGGPGPRARTPASRPDHGQLVEGGARRADLRRLQPERTSQDRLRGLVRPPAGRRPGLDTADLGRGRHGRPRRADHPDRARPGAASGGIPGRPSPTSPQSLQPLLDLAATRPGERPARRPVAAGVPQAARRTAPGGPEPGQEGREPVEPVAALRRIAYLLERDGAESYKVRAFRTCRRGRRRPAGRRSCALTPAGGSRRSPGWGRPVLR